MGTVDYMAPEQAVSAKDADGRSDIYSLGLTLWYLLVGQSAYGGDTPMAKLVAQRESPIPSLCQQRRDVPQGLDAIFRKMVAKRADDRYQTIASVIADLQACFPEEAQRALERSDPSLHRSIAERDDVSVAPTDRARPVGVQPLAATVLVPPQNACAGGSSTIALSSAVVGTDPGSLALGHPLPVDQSLADVRVTSRRFDWTRLKAIRISTAIAAVLLALLVGTALLIRATTPEGTIVVQNDQPDVVGAEVSVDGERKGHDHDARRQPTDTTQVWTDLLQATDVTKASVNGNLWRRDGSKLSGTRQDPAGTIAWPDLVIPEVISGDYELRIDLLTVKCWPIQLHLPIEGTTMTVELTRAGCALGWIDGIDATGAVPEYRNHSVKYREGEVNRFEATVRHSDSRVSIETKLNGQDSVGFSGERSRLSEPPSSKPAPRHIKISARGKVGEMQCEVHRVDLRRIAH
jgi:hypothetical protein